MKTPVPTAPLEGEIEAIIQQRQQWLDELKLDYKEEMLFELEILLKGLDRFFNIQNLPIANMEQVVSFNFLPELEIVQGFVDRVTRLSQRLLENSHRHDYQFRGYVETQLLDDLTRNRWREVSLKQDRPEDSLFLLYSSFLNLREIIKGLTQLKHVPYSLFYNLGSLLSREIAANRFFSPIGEIMFRPEYDRVGNRLVTRIVKGITEPVLQRNFSIVLLAFYRLLHYLHFVEPQTDQPETLKSSLLFFALIASESRHLTEFMERNLAQNLRSSFHAQSQEFLRLADSLAFQVGMEMKKVYQGELQKATQPILPDQMRVAIENSHGVLQNFFQQSIVQLVQLFVPELRGEDIFTSFVSKRQQSLKLREDLWVLRALMDKFEEITETSIQGATLSTYLKYLQLQKAYVRLLDRETMPMLRYGDLIEFLKYFDFIRGLSPEDLHLMDRLDRFKMESKFFKIYVETTLGHLENRSELQQLPLDHKAAELRLKRFITREMVAGH
jgi:hypothetical protein